MSFSLAYWILMLLWLFFGLWRESLDPAPNRPYRYGGHLLLFVLFVLLGWHDFGQPLHP